MMSLTAILAAPMPPLGIGLAGYAFGGYGFTSCGYAQQLCRDDGAV
jgi:hypothetical protein